MTFRPLVCTRALTAALSLVLALLAAPPAAHAAIETTADDARVVIPAPSFAFSGNSNTVFLWLRREPAEGPRAVLDIPGAITILTNTNGDLSATVSGMTDAPQTINLGIGNAIPENEWALLTLTVDQQIGDVTLAIESVSRGFLHQTASVGAPFSAGPALGNLTLGTFGSRPSMRGVFGILVVRDHAVSLADMQELFALRQHFGPYNYNNITSNGAMNGDSGALWMINHAMFSQPFNGSDSSWNSSQLAAQPDVTARASDFVVFDRSSPFRSDSLRVVRNVSSVESFVYRSPFDIDSGFFIRALPVPTTPLPTNPRAGVSPMIRRIAEQQPPQSGAPVRIVASANSRGVKAQDGLGNPANFAHGFTQVFFPDVAGIILRPARDSDVGPYFGLRSTTSSSDRIRRSDDVIPAEPTTFSRLWTGSLSPTAPGPGTGVLLPNPASFYALRARPEPGSRLTAEGRLSVSAYLLRYPGSAPATLLADMGPTQNAAGVQFFLRTSALDSSLPEAATTVLEAVSPSELVLAGDLTSINTPVEPSMMLSLGSGPFRGSVSTIEQVHVILPEGNTRIVLTRPLPEAPQPGVAVSIGPWEILRETYIHAGASQPDLWRGLEIRHAGDSTDLPVVIFAFDAFNPDDGGFAIGPAGWSGRGYQRQLDQPFPGAVEKWIATAAPDVWFAFIAHQFSPPESLVPFTETIRAAAPDVEVAWIGDIQYEDSMHESWHRFMLSNARSNNVVAASVLENGTIGAFADFAADGGFIDGGHITARGNTKIALAALDYLRAAARWPGDANNDARVDFADLNALLSNFGASGPDDGALLGDVNLDGVVDFADLNAVLSNFGTSVDD